MNSKVIVILVAAVVVVGGGFFFINGGSSGTRNDPNDGASMSSGTLASLIASGQNLECTFEHNDGVNTVSGTTYLASGGDRLRGDFTMTQQGMGSQEAHMIRDGGYNYVWGSFFPQGVKSKVTEENKDKLFDSKDGSVDENTDFECKRWNVDSSKFSLPSGVSFMDVSAQVEQMQGMSDEMQSMKCSACDQVPAGASRDQCLQAMGC